MIGPALVSTSFLCFTPKATLCRNVTGMMSSNAIYRPHKKLYQMNLFQMSFPINLKNSNRRNWPMSNEANAASTSLQQRGSASPWPLGNFNEKLWRFNFSKSMGPDKYGQFWLGPKIYYYNLVSWNRSIVRKTKNGVHRVTVRSVKLS